MTTCETDDIRYYVLSYYKVIISSLMLRMMDILMNMKRGIKDERWELQVRREYIFMDTLNCIKRDPTFSPTRRISVSLFNAAFGLAP